MFKHMEPKTRFIITLAVSGAVLFLLGFIIFYYAPPTIFEKSNSIEETKTKLAALEEKKNILLKEEEKTKSLSKNLDAVEAAIVPANNPLAFFTTLERLAERKHLTLEIHPAAGGPNAPANTLALTVSITGAIQQGIEFIKNISDLPFIVTISDLSLSRAITIVPRETKTNVNIITPVLGETTLALTLLVASRP